MQGQSHRRRRRRVQPATTALASLQSSGSDDATRSRPDDISALLISYSRCTLRFCIVPEHRQARSVFPPSLPRGVLCKGGEWIVSQEPTSPTRREHPNLDSLFSLVLLTSIESNCRNIPLLLSKTATRRGSHKYKGAAAAKTSDCLAWRVGDASASAKALPFFRMSTVRIRKKRGEGGRRETLCRALFVRSCFMPGSLSSSSTPFLLFRRKFFILLPYLGKCCPEKLHIVRAWKKLKSADQEGRKILPSFQT